MQKQYDTFKERWEPTDYRVKSLMVEHSCDLTLTPDGTLIRVTNKAGQVKECLMRNATTPEALETLRKFMNSITDELAEGYFPRKKK